MDLFFNRDDLSYCFLLVLLMTAAGKYRSPVAPGPTTDGRPDRVRQSCLVQITSEFPRDFLDLYPPPRALYSRTAICAFLADHCPGSPPAPDWRTDFTSRVQSASLVLMAVDIGRRL